MKMNKLEHNKQLKKEALFNTAFELFMTKGINKTTISDIVQKAGVAKGTFYLYFSDKYDVRNKLVSKKAGELFTKGYKELKATKITGTEDSVIYIIDYIINELQQDKALVTFIAKNLSWGIFRAALNTPIAAEENGLNFYDSFTNLIEENGDHFDNPEIMLFTIVELVGGTCHNCILYHEPLTMDEYKPFLYDTIHGIFQQHRKGISSHSQ